MTDSVASKRRLVGAVMAVALAMLAGCATAPAAPTEQFAVGRTAVADAVSAGGAEFAPVALQSAQDKLDRANAAMAAGNYRDARRYAEDAEVDAKVAAATARSRKAERALAEVEAGIRTLREELARVSLR